MTRVNWWHVPHYWHHLWNLVLIIQMSYFVTSTTFFLSIFVSASSRLLVLDFPTSQPLPNPFFSLSPSGSSPELSSHLPQHFYSESGGVGQGRNHAIKKKSHNPEAWQIWPAYSQNLSSQLHFSMFSLVSGQFLSHRPLKLVQLSTAL